MTKQGACGALAVALMVVAPVGCGSDDGSDSGGDKAPTKAAFVKKGNAICKAGNDAIDKQGKALFAGKSKPTAAQQKKFATTVLIPNVQKQVTGIGALTPPKGDEAKVDAIVSEAQAALKESKADPTALLSEDAGPFAKANKMASAYGLKACGS